MPTVNERSYRGFRVTKGDATGDQLAILVPTTYRVLHFASAADEGTDWDVINPAHPRWYVHSETTPATNYVYASHDGTNGIFNSSTALLIQVAETTVLTLAATLFTFAQDVVISSGFGLNVGSATQVTISDGDGATNLIPEGQFLGVGTAFAGGSVLAATFSTTNTRAVAPRIALVKGAAATQVATTAVANDEVVGVIIAHASDGADFETPVASIEAVVDDAGGPGAGAIGGSWEFYTTADGGTTLTLVATMGSDQNTYFANGNGVIIGNASAVATIGVNSLTPELQVLGTAGADSSFGLAVFSADNGPTRILALKSRAATIGGSGIVADNDNVLFIEGAVDDGTDYVSSVARITFEVDDVTPAADQIGGAIVFATTGVTSNSPTERVRINSSGNVLAAASTIFQSNEAGEIAFCVTNETLTIGSEGSMVAPYLSQTGAAFTDAIGGNLNGAFGFNNDSDAGPIRTLEARIEGSWLSVAISGYLIQADVEYIKGERRYDIHPDQVYTKDGKQWLDETRCLICGEPMEVGDQITFYANSRNRAGDLHNLFGHTHLENDSVIKVLTDRVETLERELARERRELVAA